MTLVGLGGRSDDWSWELLVLLHALRQTHTTQFTTTILVFAPSGTGQITTDDHLYTEALSLQTYCHHGVWSSQFPVGHDVARCVEELSGNLVEHLSLEWDSLRQNDVKGRKTVGGDHHHQVIVDVVNVTYFAVIDGLLSLEVKVCAC